MTSCWQNSRTSPSIWRHLRNYCARMTTEKRTRQLLDYDDLLVKLRDLLSSVESVRQSVSYRFRYILVDEYQDTNRLQADIIRKLASGHDNVMVVGDDSQSIYAFRGATFRNIMDFPTLFPGCRMYKLEENYRSTQPILNVANEIIRGAAEKYTKQLFTQKLTDRCRRLCRPPEKMPNPDLSRKKFSNSGRKEFRLMK